MTKSLPPHPKRAHSTGPQTVIMPFRLVKAPIQTWQDIYFLKAMTKSFKVIPPHPKRAHSTGPQPIQLVKSDKSTKLDMPCYIFSESYDQKLAIPSQKSLSSHRTGEISVRGPCHSPCTHGAYTHVCLKNISDLNFQVI